MRVPAPAAGRLPEEGAIMELGSTEGQGRPKAPPRGVGLGVVLAAVGVAAVVTVGVVCIVRIGRPVEANGTKGPVRFQGWEKPEAALVLTAQQHGYILPCGCSRPQVGGLERRYNFIQTLKARGWPVLPVDLGDVAQRHGPQNLPNVQGLIKYRYSLEAMKQIGYLGVGVGEYEAQLPLVEALAEFFLNNEKQPPFALAANVRNKDDLVPGTLHDWKVATPEGSRLKVGVLGAIGPTVEGLIKDPKIKLAPNNKLLPGLVAEMRKNESPDLSVLLYQGSLAEAKVLAENMKDFNVILCLSVEEEPSELPTMVGGTMVVAVGHKGKYVGVVGVFRGKNGKPALRYQLVSMSEEFLTPESQEKDHPIQKLMEDYTRELKSSNYLGKYTQTRHPIQIDYPNATYVGSEKCKSCHKEAFAVWQKTPHSHAHDTLVKAEKPSLRQFDGECIVCHVVGFGYKTGFTSEEATPKLKHVGCESCHGPGSAHIADTTDEKLNALMNPFKEKPGETPAQKSKRLLASDQACQRCHDVDNDVHWNFTEKWPKIAHPTTP
jgi:hypothetical protein